MTLCTLLFFAASLAAQTAHPNRIAQQAISGALTTLPGSLHPAIRTATDLGAVDSSMKLSAMTLNISLSAAQQKDLDTLVAAQQNPSSSLYRHWLTQAEYGARFGLTDSDLQAVTSWLTSQGFTVTGVSKARNAVHFSGTAWQVESAFHTQMHRFQRNGETHIANATALRVPAALANVTLNVRGLTSFRPKPRIHKSLNPAFTVASGSTYYNFLSPADWATIYGVNAIYNAGYTGSGMHVGVVGQTYIQTADITKFRTAAGLGTANLTLVCIDTTTANCTTTSAISTNGDLGEADMDIEWAGGIAKNATVDYIYAPYQDVDKTGVTDSVTGNYYDAFDALQHAIEDYTVASTGAILPVISMSYGDCESTFSGQSSYVTWVTQLGEEANSQGQTILVSSGDAGPFTCDYNDATAVDGVYVDVPADSPYYTGVGGTTLSGDEASPYSYWSETNNLVSSALQYIPETAWNDTAENATTTDPGISATGGGVSQYYSQPTWQNGLISGQSSYRMVPDVSFAASPSHDAYLVCSSEENSTTYGTMCANGFWSSGGTKSATFYQYGGTSASAPSFAGMLTLLVQKYGMLGNINPTLYGLATQANYGGVVFNATTGGDNVTPCTYNTSTDPGCPSSGSFGYAVSTSFPYYNMATGLGSINGGGLYSALGSIVGSGGSGTTAKASYTMTTGSTAITYGNTATIYFTPTNYSGTVTLTATSSSSNLVPTLSASSVSLANGIQGVTLSFGVSSTSSKHAPQLPWKSSGLIMAAVLGAPFAIRKRRAGAVLMVALALSLAGLLMACGGGSSSTSSSKTTTPQAGTYTVTVAAQGSGTVTNPSNLTFTVTVP